jgi:uncharacterized membrane protein (DUF373 family)
VDTSSIYNVLFITALALLIVVSSGIVYLTTVEWRDRRRQEKDRKSGR